VVLRRLLISCICLLSLLVALIGASMADANVHLGSVVQPAGSSATSCLTEFVIVEAASDPSVPYAAPPGERKLTQWEVSTTHGTAGAAVTLVILRPAAGSYDVVATDTEVLPSPLPADGVASFRPASPIAVGGGEVLGLYSSTPGGVDCFFAGGTTSAGGSAAALAAPVPPAPGQTLPVVLPPSSGGVILNVAATLHGDQDVGVTTAASPANVTVGALALLRSTVTNHGPESDPVAFTDTVPAGLTVDSVFAGPNRCATAGQTVTCTIDGLAPGQSAPVSILVTPTAAGSFLNDVSVAPQAGTADPVSGDDSAAARLDVAPPPASGPTPPGERKTPRACVVPNLRRLLLATVKRLLGPLGCKAGKVRHAHNRKIARGKVIRTTPKRGTYSAGRRIGLVVSSGPPRRHRHRHG
jgi:hypothetical protein